MLEFFNICLKKYVTFTSLWSIIKYKTSMAVEVLKAAFFSPYLWFGVFGPILKFVLDNSYWINFPVVLRIQYVIYIDRWSVSHYTIIYSVSIVFLCFATYGCYHPVLILVLVSSGKVYLKSTINLNSDWFFWNL